MASMGILPMARGDMLIAAAAGVSGNGRVATVRQRGRGSDAGSCSVRGRE